jgi:hypothetical protein
MFQDEPALPGQVYTASTWFFTYQFDQISGSNACYLEVQFRDAGDNVLRDYRSGYVDTNFPTSTWINLTPTNIYSGDFATFLGTSPYLYSPPGTAKVRTQITFHEDPYSSPGSVYVDSMNLMLREPITTVSSGGSNVRVSFPTLFGPNYNVYYKTNLREASWHLLSTVAGDGSVKSVTDPSSTGIRFYTVNTQ